MTLVTAAEIGAVCLMLFYSLLLGIVAAVASILVPALGFWIWLGKGWRLDP